MIWEGEFELGMGGLGVRNKMETVMVAGVKI